MKILVTGASGFIGERLTALAQSRGHQVLPVSRKPRAGGYDWSPASLEAGVAAADAIVHLAGENLFGKRWTEAQKKKLVDSRVETTDRLARLAAQRRPVAFLSASAIGYYGPSERPGLDESAPPGNDFLATLCRRWEESTAPASAAGARTVLLRTGIVLGREDGALKQMLPPFKLGVGGPIGSGRQWFSWIHIADEVGLILHLLESAAASGPFNLTAPNPVTMREMAKTLGKVLHRPAVLPVPGFALKVALGDVADVLLTGQHVLPKSALESGYRFQFPELEGALRDILGRPS
jgi:uncharacterized protein (TIGR01777 family)